MSYKLIIAALAIAVGSSAFAAGGGKVVARPTEKAGKGEVIDTTDAKKALEIVAKKAKAAELTPENIKSIAAREEIRRTGMTEAHLNFLSRTDFRGYLGRLIVLMDSSGTPEGNAKNQAIGEFIRFTYSLAQYPGMYRIVSNFYEKVVDYMLGKITTNAEDFINADPVRRRIVTASFGKVIPGLDSSAAPVATAKAGKGGAVLTIKGDAKNSEDLAVEAFQAASATYYMSFMTEAANQKVNFPTAETFNKNKDKELCPSRI